MLLFLARHGQTLSEGRFYGHEDVPLSPIGRAQMERLAARLERHALDAVYASDLQRARVGAELVAGPRGLAVQADPRLREMCLGCLEGLDRGAAVAQHPELAVRDYASMVEFRMPGGGESFLDVWQRVAPALQELRGRHRGQRVALVGHNSVNRLILGDALGLGPERVFSFGQDYGCLNLIDYRGDRPVVLLVNSRIGETA
jgi:alpha-ribazole phosphatase/probable phosphoglycerate mutase